MNFKTTVEREKEGFAKLYPPVTIGYDGNETDYFRREKFLETLEQAMTKAALAAVTDLEASIVEKYGELDGVQDLITTLKASLTTSK